MIFFMVFIVAVYCYKARNFIVNYYSLNYIQLHNGISLLFSTEASIKHTFKRYVGTMCNINVGIYTHVCYMCIYTYRIVGKFGRGESLAN